MQPKLLVHKGVEECDNLTESLKIMLRDVQLTEQLCGNLRNFDLAPPGVQITGAWLNLTLGTAAKLCADIGKELNTCAYQIKETKKAIEAGKGARPKK